MTNRTTNSLVATNVLIIPTDWEQFKALARSQGSSAGALLRGFIQREVRRIAKDAAPAK